MRPFEVTQISLLDESLDNFTVSVLISTLLYPPEKKNKHVGKNLIKSKKEAIKTVNNRTKLPIDNKTTFINADTYLEPCQTFMKELYCENS